MKKKCILMFFGIFPIACVNIYIYIYIYIYIDIYLGDFPAVKKKKKKRGEENYFLRFSNL